MVDLSEGFSGSDIQDVCTRLHRRRIVTEKQPSLHDALQALQNLAMGEGEERRFLSAFKDKDPAYMVNMLRARNEKRYSYGAIGDLLGVSKTTAERWAAKEGVTHNGYGYRCRKTQETT